MRLSYGLENNFAFHCINKVQRLWDRNRQSFLGCHHVGELSNHTSCYCNVFFFYVTFAPSNSIMIETCSANYHHMIIIVLTFFCIFVLSNFYQMTKIHVCSCSHIYNFYQQLLCQISGKNVNVMLDVTPCTQAP